MTTPPQGGCYHAHFTAEEPASFPRVTQPVGGKAGIEPKSPVSKHLLRCPGADSEKLYGRHCQSDPNAIPGRRAAFRDCPHPPLTYASKNKYVKMKPDKLQGCQVSHSHCETPHIRKICKTNV